MNISNDNTQTNPDYYNQWLKRLNTQLKEPTIDNFKKLLSKLIRKRYCPFLPALLPTDTIIVNLEYLDDQSLNWTNCNTCRKNPITFLV